MDRIVLIGFRGCGKTVVGRLLADLLNLPFIDTDDLIEERSGMPISDIFAFHGEEEFRRWEHDIIMTSDDYRGVISTGGGAILDQENVRRLRAGSTVFFLMASPEVIEARISGSGRPPLTTLPLREEILTTLQARLPLYIAAADFCIDTASANPAETCATIAAILQGGSVSRRECESAAPLLDAMQPDPSDRARVRSLLLPPAHLRVRLSGILGNPVRHSISPEMYNHLFSRFRLNYYYTRFEWDEPAAVIDLMKRLDMRGLSVTIPFKSAVLPSLDQLDVHAKAIGAANTVIQCGGILYGYNTDWLGVKCPLSGMRGSDAVVLGAGGAAAAAVYALKELEMEVTVLNRTPGRGASLAGRFGCAHGPLEDFTRVDPDVVIHATPVGMAGDERSLLGREQLHEGMTVFDLVYTPAVTPLLREANAAGCRTIRGMEMFIHQAREQFRLFTGIDVDPDVIREILS